MPRHRLSLSLDAGVLIGLALLLLILPLRWIGAFLTAGLIHELFHLLAVRLCGGQVLRIRIGISGAKIETEPLEYHQALLCSLAGPAGGLMLIPLAGWFPRLAICAGIQSLYNLLPVYPLDGGRALRWGMRLLLPGKAGQQVCNWVENVCLCGIGLLGIYGTFALRLGLLPFLAGLGIILRACREKDLANRAVRGYNRVTIIQ